MVLSLFSRCVLIFSLILCPFVLTQCLDPASISDLTLEIDTETIVLPVGEAEPGEMVILVTRVDNCLARNTIPTSYSYIGISVKYKLRELEKISKRILKIVKEPLVSANKTNNNNKTQS